MAESTSALSMYDLVLAVARAAGVAYYGNSGDKRGSIPINAHDLDLCRETVNAGIRMFIADAPETGWRWQNRIASVTFATVETTGTCSTDGDATSLIDTDLEDTYDEDTDLDGYYVYDRTQKIYAAVDSYDASAGDITVTEWLDYDDNVSDSTPEEDDVYSITDVKTVNGEKTRYPLDQDFMGEISGKITYAADSNRGHIIGWCHPNQIRTMWESTVSDSNPTRAAVRPWRNRRWELIVNPSPTQGDTVQFPYKVGFDALQIEAGIATVAGADSITIDGIKNLYPDDYFNGWTATIMAGTGRSSYAEIEDYTGASGKFDIVGDDWLKSNGKPGGVDPVVNSSAYFEPVANKHPAGMQFDEVIVSACLAKAETIFEGLQLDYSPMQKYLEKDLKAAYRIDAGSAPKRLGRMLPGSGRGGSVSHIRNTVTNWNYNSVTGLWDDSIDV